MVAFTAIMPNYPSLSVVAFGTVFLWSNRTHRFMRGYSQFDAQGIIMAVMVYVLYTAIAFPAGYYWGTELNERDMVEWFYKSLIYFLAAFTAWFVVSITTIRGIGDVREGLEPPIVTQRPLDVPDEVNVGLVRRITVPVITNTQNLEVIFWHLWGVGLQLLAILGPTLFLFFMGDPEDRKQIEFALSDQDDDDAERMHRVRRGYLIFTALTLIAPAVIALLIALGRWIVMVAKRLIEEKEDKERGIYPSDVNALLSEVFKTALWTFFNFLVTFPPGISLMLSTYSTSWHPGSSIGILEWPFWLQLFIVIVFALPFVSGYIWSFLRSNPVWPISMIKTGRGKFIEKWALASGAVDQSK